MKIHIPALSKGHRSLTLCSNIIGILRYETGMKLKRGFRRRKFLVITTLGPLNGEQYTWLHIVYKYSIGLSLLLSIFCRIQNYREEKSMESSTIIIAHDVSWFCVKAKTIVGNLECNVWLICGAGECHFLLSNLFSTVTQGSSFYLQYYLSSPLIICAIFLMSCAIPLLHYLSTLRAIFLIRPLTISISIIITVVLHFNYAKLFWHE